ncbi:nuclease-related domain-containing protein [Ureibacillus sp. MALMAid1270]|uniref:nuclease-related domain-containing protein n=1 Tax=Ureibacillus sp. MALMAid1270 TaxID=3411629 RepID=UPI003BA5D86D
MIVLERSVPYNLVVLDALLRRVNLIDSEFEYYMDLYTNLKVGLEGELLVDQEWEELEIPIEYALFHNYEAVNGFGKSHQIDTLFLSKYFIWLLEIKNISGILNIEDAKSQFIRTKFDGSSDSYSNPVEQIERHARFIRRTIRNWGINIPVETAIIIVKDSTIIGEVPKTVSIFHRSGMQSKLNELFRKYPNSYLSDHNFKVIQKKLMEMYKRKIWRPKIKTENIKKGVICNNCGKIMKYIYGAFVCPICNKKSKDDILKALIDYRYLINEWITNRELRTFLGIDSRYSVARLIKSFNFEFVGDLKSRKYKIPDIGYAKTYYFNLS